MDQVMDYFATRHAAFNVWSEQPVTNGTVLYFGVMVLLFIAISLHRLHRDLKAIHWQLYRQVHGSYPDFDLLE